MAGAVASEPRQEIATTDLPLAAAVDDEPIALFDSARVLLNKPIGCVTALRDPRHPTAYELLDGAPLHAELRPVGRLDRETSGLLLWTTDGAEIQRLTHPKRAVPRTYQAALAQAHRPLPADLVLDDGHRPRVDALVPLARDEAHPSLDIPADAPVLASITITGGAYHEVRRIFAALGSHVLGLCRVRFGDIELPRDLRAGRIPRAAMTTQPRPICTSSWSSRRFTGTRATPGGPAWRRARSCTWSGRSASRSRTRRCGAPGSTTGRASRPAVWPDWAAFERALPSLGDAVPVHGARAAPLPGRRLREAGGADLRPRERRPRRRRCSRATPRTPSRSRCSIRSCARSTCRRRSRSALYEVRRQWGWTGGAASRRPQAATSSELGSTCDGPAHVGGEAELLEQQDRVPADVELQRRPAEARRAGTVVVVLVPVLALEEVHQRQPADVLRGRLVRGRRPARMWQMLLTKHCACSANTRRIGPIQKNAASPNGSAGEEREHDQRDLHARPHPVRRRVDVLAVLRDRRRAGLPQPAQVRPPEAADARAGDVLGRVGLARGAGGGSPPTTAASPSRSSCAKKVSTLRTHRVQLHRLVRDARGGSRRSCPRPPRKCSTAAASATGQPGSGDSTRPDDRRRRGSAPSSTKVGLVAAGRPPPRLLPGRVLGHVGRVERPELRRGGVGVAFAGSLHGPPRRAARRRAAAHWSAATSGLPVVSSFSP